MDNETDIFWFTTKTGGQFGVHKDNLTLTTVRPENDHIEILVQSEWRYVHLPYEPNRHLVIRRKMALPA